MSLLKDIPVVVLIVVCTAGLSSWYTQKSLQVTNIVNEVNNQVKLNSAAAATLKTESVSREFVEIVVKDLTSKVVEAKQEAVQAQVQSAKSEGVLAALAPVMQNPALQETLQTLAKAPEAVAALQQVATAVEQASAQDDNSALELVTRIDVLQENITKLEALDVPGLIKRVEELQSTTPSLTVLQENLDKLSKALTESGNKLIADEIVKLSEKFQRDINNESQPLQVQISSANSSILNLQSSVSSLNTKDLDMLEQISNIHNDIGGLNLNMSTIARQVVPIGGTFCVADWLGATIESNFVRADGQTLSEPLSLFDGLVMPDLNVAKLYLRGGSTGGVLQEASIPLLGNVLEDIDFSTASISDGAFGNNFSLLRVPVRHTIPIKLGDALELRPRSLTCTYFIRIF